MSEDNLTMFLCEAERVLNDRLLTKLSEDPNGHSKHAVAYSWKFLYLLSLNNKYQNNLTCFNIRKKSLNSL